MIFPTFLALALSIAPVALAAPHGVERRLFGERAAATGTVSAFSQANIDAKLQRPAFFARAAYCNTQSVKDWSCGEACEAIKGIKVLQGGGDEGRIPFYFIAFDSSANSLVVAHEGTDAKNILSIANDAQFLLTDLDTTLFPGAPSGVKVHSGFQATFQRTAQGILAGVKDALKSTGATNVVVTGHSLGAAIATMDAVMLRANLPASVPVSSTVFGLPRGGNNAWADFVDKSLGSSFAYVTNQHDPVPIVPPRLIGFQHPSNEIHINAVNAQGQATDVVSCPGQDNINCATANSLIGASVANHLGPYFDNISFGGKQCASTAKEPSAAPFNVPKTS